MSAPTTGSTAATTAADADLRDGIERAITRLLPDVDPRCVRALVRNGEATLVGRVPWRRDLAVVERVAAGIPGVTRVRNRLDFVWDDRT